MNSRKDIRKPEILAPAGSMEALKAAVYAGADAIYLGGSRFGARAFANNFEGEELVHAIEYAHMYGVKVYLTINTLFREEEIEQLYDYLLLPYEKGLDAVIVQDFGVMKYVHQFFPDLPIHASTQMTITTPYAYTILKEYGVTRVVPARELSLEEIADLKLIHKSLETEIFVQGALCYCYSGQCLMSSVLGGRSGNRGRCAQTCRLPYKVLQDDRSYEGHLLSPKDLCGLQHIPSLIQAGVDSFKIEGRMKKPEYVAVCVRAYRKCVDAYFENALTDELLNIHMRCMADVFNRGGFTDGYYKQHNGKKMMFTDAPGNIGVLVGSISKIHNNKVSILLNESVSVGDIFVIKGKKEEITLTNNCQGSKLQTIVLNAPKTNTLKIGAEVRRMQNTNLQRELTTYLTEEPLIELSGALCLKEGQQAAFTVRTTIGQIPYEVTCHGDLVECASKNPLNKETVIQKIAATGNTNYHFQDLQVELSDNPFYSLKALKDIRRNAICLLENCVKQSFYRTQMVLKDMINVSSNKQIHNNPTINSTEVMISNVEQFEIVKDKPFINSILFDVQFFETVVLNHCLEMCNQDAYFVLPSIVRKQNKLQIEELIRKVMEDDLPVKGFVVRNIDEFAMLKFYQYEGKVITDYSFYTMNSWAFDFAKEHFSNIQITLPVELNETQLVQLNTNRQNTSIIVYGYQPLMISAQCLQNTTGTCNHGDQDLWMTDRYKKTFRIHTICKYCYNIIYNGVPTVLFDLHFPNSLQQCDMRLHFTCESTEEIQTILDCYENKSAFSKEKTRGHYKRGVD